MLAGSSMERMSQIGVQVWRAFMTCLVYSVYGETLSSINLHCVLEDFPIVVLYLPASLRGVHLFHLPPVALCSVTALPGGSLVMWRSQ